MKTTAVTDADLGRSVLAVPPLARHADFSVNVAENKRLARHLVDGGVSSLLYGGNANFYNIGVHAYESLLGMLAELGNADTWVIPSIGPDYGKAMDQVAVLKQTAFPTAMLLPPTQAMTPDGIATGIRRLAEALGRPLIAYVKAETYLEPGHLAALIEDGAVTAIKYAIIRENPAIDPYLSRLVDIVDPRRIVSGIGERPVQVHLSQFKLQGFTSGSVCIAPRLSMQILAALKRGDHAAAAALCQRFIPLEDLRDAHSPIRVLHEAVRLSGLADMGPMLPMLSNLTDPEILAPIQTAAQRLLAEDHAMAAAA